MKVARLLGYCLLAVSAIYFIAAAWKYAGSMPPVTWNGQTAAILAAVTSLYLLQFLSSGIAWHFWLGAVHEPSRPAVAITLFALSSFAKYVPGSVAHHIARVALGRRYGLGTAGMVISIVLETGWAILAGIALAAVSLTFVGPSLTGVELPSLLQVMLIGAVALLVPLAGVWLIGIHRPAILNRWLGPQRIAHPRVKTLLACFLIYAANLATSGWIVDLLAHHLFGAPSHPLTSVGVFAVAWLAGVVALVSPGGIGVREAVMIAGLTPAYGSGAALGVAVAYRIVTTLGDGIGFLCGFLAERRLARQVAQS